ncbi:hypothetical protein [uncultured Hyphomonas sp.]|uniref:hypothetical protein n=1 Tax=uncultured Hyphomonas sp. TaxID=225298 RepID=UPI002AAC02B6|nr:hypothetical protein [uncultured Hyphomonas sp.]
MSFLRPPEGFPPHLACIWPLVWCQLLLLRVAVRAAYGQASRYWWSITPNGRVFLTRIHFGLKDKAARELVRPRAFASDRLAAACRGEAYTPAYIANPTISAQPGECRGPERYGPHGVVMDHWLCRDVRQLEVLPLPET